MDTVIILWCLSIGGIVSAILIFLARRFPLQIGRFLPPNIISIIHAPIIWIGYFALLHSSRPVLQILGFQKVVFGGVLDAVDGMVARGVDRLIALQILPQEEVKFALEKGWTEFYNIFYPAVEKELDKGNTHIKIYGIKVAISPPKSRLKQLFYLGGTPIGKHVDPLFDKAGMLPLFFSISWELCFLDLKFTYFNFVIFICAIIGYLIIAVDLIGTLIRFFKPQWLKDAKSTMVGKNKVHAQWGWLLLFELFGREWVMDESPLGILFLTIFLSGILIMGIGSITSKLKVDLYY